ncbi:protein RRP5 isoform X2 [Tripterygium wilfordii]|uniref:Protein RRP5 homolog n=1 Tax=Tripterygium wilfordii TaxID=458696 RepID=A0A7J7CTL0_TRIWF|nr:rRNA biogenesis protein RRP5 [Tripterygium wilfordii]KAF5737374.1 protein RRP5 isoform X2 [Tripterygium wilfordii]
MAAPSKKSQKRNSTDGGRKFNKSSKKAFKPSKERNDSVQSKAMALQFEDDVPDFPRGRGSSLSQRECEEIHAEVDAEFGAESNKSKKNKRMKIQKKTASPGDDLGSLFGNGITGKLPRFANKITLKNISPGMKLWGVVAEVNEKDLVISLPGGLRGLVRTTDALDPVVDDEIEESEGSVFPDIFHVGQLVSCTVLQVDDDKKENGKRKIWLSLRLSLLHKGFTLDAIQEGMVLTAYVRSVEDHGYILHFGPPSFMGFLPKNSQADSKGVEVKTGKLLQGVVRQIDKTRKVVYLSSDPETVSKSVTKDLKGISIDLLVPGMMVNARVQSTLENGIMLSFLTYFTGTVDMFHLQNTVPSSNWKVDYIKNKKVNARILFVDPLTRAVALTLNPHLVHNRASPSLVKIGDIYDHSKVVRVDRGSGLLLEIPSTPVSTPAYVSISDVAEEEVKKLEKKFKEGSNVRVRILGFRHLEGLATGVLKASAFEGPVFTHSDVKPGMLVRAKITAVDSFGAIVQFPGGVKALCPLRHMSEFEIAKPGKKFKIGAELMFRVLGCKSKRITVTHKKTLVKSKLGILGSYTDATEALRTHGWITKIEKHGCFVHFYNGVQGFAPRSELGLDPGSEPSSMYHVGQVVKCRILSSIPASRRITLSFLMKPTRVSEDDAVKLGSLVSGVVDKVTPSAVIVCVSSEGRLKGSISTEHLSDHLELATSIKSVLKPGYEFDQLLVLDIESNNLILSAKYSLVNSAQDIPSDPSQIRPQSVIHGYICNIIETGCFVRFLGRLTGFSPKSKAMNDQRSSLFEAFHIGQSVRANILDVNNETGRITLSLKQSCCSSADASFLQEFFLLEEKIARLQSSDSKRSELKWVRGFDVGSVIEGKIQEAKEFGVVVSFEKYNDVFGFITHYQLGGTAVEKGSLVRAVVLDIAKAEFLVDLSLKPEFFDKSGGGMSDSRSEKKKRKREASKELEVHQTVNAIVEIVKEKYLVLSIPEYDYAIGYASVFDFNIQTFPHKQFQNGQSVTATVMALPNPSSSGRLLLLLNSISEATETSSLKKAKKKSSYCVGSLVQAEITEIKPLELRLKFGIGFHGRIHITEVNDGNALEDPFSNFRVGQTVTARILAKANQSDNKRSYLWELSVRPKMLTGSYDLEDELMDEKLKFLAGECVSGYVYKVDNEWAWLTVSRHVKGQLNILDSSFEPTELQEFQKRFYVGKAVSGHVLNFNIEKKLLRLVLRPVCGVSGGPLGGEDSKVDVPNNNVFNEQNTSHIHEGDIVGGRILKILPGVGGLIVQIGPHLHGRIHFTELKDSWVSDPLSGYHEGQFVKCKVLEISRTVKSTVHIDLSLRLSLDGMLSQNKNDLPDHVDTPFKHLEKIDDLHPNTIIQGYVKSITSKGCFILLSRKLDAKILLSNLSDGYIEDLEKEFPVGKLVTGRVISVEPLSNRVEVTLKTLNGSSASKSEINDLSCVHVGDIISGRIRRVESYGLFITIDNTSMVGLCHVSEISDEHIDNLEAKYRSGEKVTAKILKVDEERRRISLGIKSSYLRDSSEIHSSEQEFDKGNGSVEDGDVESLMHTRSSSPEIQIMGIDGNEECTVLAQAESRSFIRPLEVILDDIEDSDVHIVASQNQGHIDTVDGKERRQAKKKAKEEREQEIRAAEERLLEKNVPTTADDHEKLVRSSPNSSLVWMKYMAFVLSLADVEKARSIAERALRTINVREENEKLNIWVAYFNLENEFGNPPEEAIMKVFNRALQCCDPKKIHLALLGMYERTGQNKFADELLDKMIKKFKHSCKVWLRRVRSLLTQQQDRVQSVVQRALLSLPRHKHIKFISQTAILEFKCGVPERGRSLLEGILREYPKRTDLWSIYLDQEIRLGDVDVIRALFERAISLSLPPKKMKFLFKKYLEFEKSSGDEKQVEYVKQKAMDYVQSTLT